MKLYTMRSIILLMAIFVLASCKNNIVDLDSDDPVKVNITASGTLFTRSTTTENQIAQIKVLVFKLNGSDYVFDYIADVHNVASGAANSTNISVTLFSTPLPTKVVVIANANDAVDAALPILTDETELSVKQRLNKTFTAAPLASNLPMWGEYLFADGLSTSMQNNVYGMTALRAVCRVDVNATAVGTSFEMTSIQSYRANDLIRLMPDSYTTNPLKVDAPTIPPGSMAVVNTLPLPVTGNISTAQLYLSESASPADARDATCIVVGGRFNNSPTVTYFRLDVAPPVNGYPLGQLLRNHHYQFNITRIEGPGWPTPDDAANNLSSNITSSVIDWTDIYNNININGTNYFFIPNKSTSLSGNINSVSLIDILTDIQNPTLYWSDNQGNPSSQYTEPSIVNDYFAVTISSTDIRIQALDYNDFGNGVREQYFTVAAGRLRIPIKITQEENPFVHQSRWSQFNVDQFGTFTNSINDFGQLYVWSNRTPFPPTGVASNWPSAIGPAVWSVPDDPCPLGWRMPRSTDLTDLSRDYPSRRAYNGTDPANPNSGVWVAPTQVDADNATFANPGNALFFPLSGIRNAAQNGTASNAIGIYWSNHTDGNWRVLTATFSGATQNNSLGDIRTQVVAYSVRCIRDL